MKPLLAILASLLLAGCATPNSPKILTQLDNHRETLVSVGQDLVVKLPSNHTTGYCWKNPVAAESILQRVGEPTYIQDRSASGMVGVGGTEVWHFKVMKTGQETLRFEYARPWEKPSAPAKVLTFNVLSK